MKGFRYSGRMLLVLLMLSVSMAAQAGAGRVKLDRFFKGLKTMRAQFVQTLLDANHNEKERSEGVLLLSRPGRFRLEYTKPYSQLYVADGKHVWMYDKDLEQITVRPETAALGSTPAALLSSDVPLDRNFRLTELGNHSGFTWLELRPKQKDATFTYIRLALDGDVVRAMEMGDSLGQTTRLYFDKVSRNPHLAASEFEFTPPPDVDVVGDPN